MTHHNKKTFQKTKEQTELEETILEIKQSLKDFEAGRFSSAEEVFDKLKQRISESEKSVKTKH